jgi:predicted RNase H-like HicB family nuclease
MRYCYPATFAPHENGKGAYGVTFADLPGCVSVGEDLPHAMLMAQEALGLHLSGMLEDGIPLPPPSTPDEALEKEKLWYREEGDTFPEATVCQYVVAETYALKAKTEPPVRISISLKPTLVEKIDALADSMGMSRSAVLNVAARDYINREGAL